MHSLLVAVYLYEGMTHALSRCRIAVNGIFHGLALNRCPLCLFTGLEAAGDVAGPPSICRRQKSADWRGQVRTYESWREESRKGKVPRQTHGRGWSVAI